MRMLGNRVKPIVAAVGAAALIAGMVLGQETVNRPRRVRVVLQTGHWPSVQRFRFSNDGKYVLVTGTGEENSAKLYDGRSGLELRVFGGHIGEVAALALSHDERYAATSGFDGSLRVWDVQSGTLVKAFRSTHGPLYSVAFSNDGGSVAAGGEKYTVHIWDIASGTEKATLITKSADETIVDGATSMEFFPDDKRILIRDTKIRVFDIANRREIVSVGSWQGILSIDGKMLVTGIDGNPDGREGIQITDLDSGARTVFGSRLPTQLALSGDKQLIAAVDEDGVTHIWDVANQKELWQLRHPAKRIDSIAYSPDGKGIATGGEDGAVRLWSTSTGKEIRRYVGGQSEGTVSYVGFTADGNGVLGNCRSSLYRWNVATGISDWTIGTLAHHLSDPRFVRRGGPIAVRQNRAILLFDPKTGKQSRIADQGPRVPRSEEISSFAVSAGGGVVLSGYNGQRARLWELPSHREIRSLQGSRGSWRVSADVERGTGNAAIAGWIWSAAFSPDGKLAAGGTNEGHIHLWNVTTGRELATFTQGDETEAITKVDFSPDGKRLVSASWDKTARIWNLTTRRETARLQNSDAMLTAIFSPDGSSVITNYGPDLARLWSVQTGKMIREFRGHRARVTSAAFLPNGRSVLTGGEDGVIILWNVETGQVIRRFPRDTAPIFDISLSDNGSLLASTAGDHLLRIWDIRSGKELAMLASFIDGSWVVADAEGRFDASDPNNAPWIHWFVDEKPLNATQKALFYTPGLLPRILNAEKLPALNYSAFSAAKVATKAPILAQATGGGQDQSKPSLEETSNFIVRTLDQTIAKFEFRFVGRGVTGKIGRVTFYQNVAIEGCKIRYEKVSGNRDKSTRVVYRPIDLSSLTLPIGEATPSQTPGMAGMKETITESLDYNISLRYRQAVSYTEQQTNKGVDQQPKQETSTYASWQFQDEQIANRMRNALTHAVKLCGGKEEENPF